VLTQPAVAREPGAVLDDDARALLPAVLQAVQPVVRDLRRVLVPPYPENAALFVKALGFIGNHRRFLPRLARR